MAEEHAMVYPPINFLCIGAKLKGNSQGALSVSAAAAETSAFTLRGLYDMWCDVDVYLKVGSGTVTDVTSGNGYLLRANTTVPFIIDENDKIGAITSGDGTLRYHKVS
jgi:hypothetical protein